MNMVIDERLSKKYKGLIREPEEIEEIVLHGTGGGEAKSIIAWMASDGCERAKNYLVAIGLFPYEIGRDGMVYNIMPDEDWYYHSDSGWHDKTTIGIELVNDRTNNANIYTEDQYQSLFSLIEYLINKYPSIRIITSHDHNRKKYSGLGPKPCPGKFDFERVKGLLVEKSLDNISIVI